MAATRSQSIQSTTSGTSINMKLDRWVASTIGVGVALSRPSSGCVGTGVLIFFLGFDIRVSDTLKKLPTAVGLEPKAIE
jgi:hypothetical protein